MPYIKHISTTELRGISPLEIDLTPAEGKPFRHLVLTGPNGTGKTSVLGAIAAKLSLDLEGRRPSTPNTSQWSSTTTLRAAIIRHLAAVLERAMQLLILQRDEQGKSTKARELEHDLRFLTSRRAPYSMLVRSKLPPALLASLR